MWIRRLFLIIILLFLPFQGRTDEILQDVDEDTTPVLMERLRKLDKADVWKEDATNSQIELKSSKALDMQLQQIDNVLDPTTAQDAATKAYVDAVTITQYGARAYLSASAQTISTGTDTKVTLDGESFDIQGEFTSNKYTATKAGKYIVVGSIRYPSPIADKIYYAKIKVDGSVVTEVIMQSSSTSTLTVVVSDILDLSATNYVELFTEHDAGGDETIANANSYTYMAIMRIPQLD